MRVTVRRFSRLIWHTILRILIFRTGAGAWAWTVDNFWYWRKDFGLRVGFGAGSFWRGLAWLGVAGWGGRLFGTFAGSSIFGLSLFVSLAAVFVRALVLVPIPVFALFVFLLSVFPLLFLLFPVSVLVLICGPLPCATRCGWLSVLGMAAGFLLFLLLGCPAHTRHFTKDPSVTVYQPVF